MLSKLEEIKQFIEWCQKNKVKSFDSGDISFELSELAFVEQMTDSQMEQKVINAAEDTLVDTAKQELENEDDDLLFWSTRT